MDIFYVFVNMICNEWWWIFLATFCIFCISTYNSNSIRHYVLSAVALHSHVKWGHNLCVWVAPPILMSKCFFPFWVDPCPGGKCAYSKGQECKGLWTHAMYGTYGDLSCYIYVDLSINIFHQLLLWVFTCQNFTSNLSYFSK